MVNSILTALEIRNARYPTHCKEATSKQWAIPKPKEADLWWPVHLQLAPNIFRASIQ